MKVVVLGAGISGHTAATLLKKQLGKKVEVVVISPNSNWNWIPSNIWVGVGAMSSKDVTFSLKPIYDRLGIQFIQAKATTIFPEGKSNTEKGIVEFESTSQESKGTLGEIEYDYCINATGPKLNFSATPGLGPEEGNTVSVCTYGHAEEANSKFQDAIKRLKNGERLSFVFGTGHGMCTCQGAAFEYLFNVDHELRKAGVRDNAKILWISNEFELGDFGMAGMHLEQGGFVTSSKIFAESLFTERGIQWKTRTHVTKIENNKIFFTTLEGENGFVHFDFSMLIPPFSGVGLKAFGKNGEDLTPKLFAANGMMKVDADYQPKLYENWDAKDWPKKYQSPYYSNLFGIGIAFAPPHPISKVMKNAEGIQISPTPPRTGMPSAIMGKVVAQNIAHQIKTKSKELKYEASMANMGAACIASAGNGLLSGSAVSMTVYPIVPDFKRYPKWGRSLTHTTGEIGLSGHWIKLILHYMFLYKAKCKPGWWMIPE
jgi:sulfide:quinone oxidoreductase